MSNILGLIPARGGSKGIPRKNIVPLAGRPLLAYTCEAARKSKLIKRVVLSTDDIEIARVGREWEVEVPFIRPSDLARDDTPSIAVAQHAVRWLREHEGWKVDVLVLLQPTSPLRLAKHIDESLDHLLQTGADTVVSVVKVPHRFSPHSIMTLSDGKLEDFSKERLPGDRYRRQDLPEVFARNGPAVLATRVNVLFEQESFYGKTIVPYVMSEEESVDVDTLFELRLAEWIMTESNVLQVCS